MGLEPNANIRSQLREKVMTITDRFLSGIKEAPAYVAPDKYSLDSLQINLNEKGHNPDDVFAEIEKYVDLPGINPASGNHLGYIPGGGLYTSALGDYWADITNRYAGIFYADPGAVKIENELIRWMIDLVGYPPEAWGNLASGGSIANLTAIIAAREAKGITPENVRKAVIYLSDQTHHCVEKALKIAGLNFSIVRKVPMNADLKMDPTQLELLIKKDINDGYLPFLLVSSAGTTDSGVIDPISDLDRLAKENNIWHHVDAAYGVFFLLSESCRSALLDMKKSDSLVMDPHKSLFLPYGLGVVLVKDREVLKKAFSYEANYMQDATTDDLEVSPADVSPELTKHFRGLRMWLPLKIHGLRPFRSALEEKHLLAKYFYYEILKIEGFEVFRAPEISVVMFRYRPENDEINRYNQKLIKEIHQDGRIFLSTTTVSGEFWLRVAILVFRTHKDAIDRTLSLLNEKVKEINSHPDFVS